MTNSKEKREEKNSHTHTLGRTNNFLSQTHTHTQFRLSYFVARICKRRLRVLRERKKKFILIIFFSSLKLKTKQIMEWVYWTRNENFISFILFFSIFCSRWDQILMANKDQKNGNRLLKMIFFTLYLWS